MNQLVLSSEAARIIGVSIATIHQWERNGRLAALKTTHGVRLFDLADCLALQRERESQRTAASHSLAEATAL